MIMRFSQVFNSETKGITSAAALVGISSAISALLGIVRDRLLASRFGASAELDVYLAAFRIPDFVYGIIIVGGITAAFLPVFSEYFQKGESANEKLDKKTWPLSVLELTNNVLNCFSLLLIGLCLVLFIFAPRLIDFIAPGFSIGQKSLTVKLMRIMFLSPFLLGISNIISDILQYFNRFLAFSLAPIFYNLGIISGIIFFVPHFGLLGLAYGVIGGALMHLLVQLPSAFDAGYRYQIKLDFHHLGLIKIFKLMVPRFFGQATYHLNLVTITAIASTFSAGSIAIFNFSNNLQFFPITLISVSFATAAFPLLTKAWANGRKDEFLASISSAIRQTIFFIIPISFLFFLLRAQIVRLILGSGKFSWSDTRLTAASLGIFSFGLVASSLVPLLTRAFFAIKDTKTPVIISMVTVSLNILFALSFVPLMSLIVRAGHGTLWESIKNFFDIEKLTNVEVLSLPLALSLSTIIQGFLLSKFLLRMIKRGNHWEKNQWEKTKREIANSFKTATFSSLVMSVFVYFALRITVSFVDMKTFIGVFLQTLIAGTAGVLIYFLSSWLVKSPELMAAKSLFINRFVKNDR